MTPYAFRSFTLFDSVSRCIARCSEPPQIAPIYWSQSWQNNSRHNFLLILDLATVRQWHRHLLPRLHKHREQASELRTSLLSSSLPDSEPFAPPATAPTGRFSVTFSSLLFHFKSRMLLSTYLFWIWSILLREATTYCTCGTCTEDVYFCVLSKLHPQKKKRPERILPTIASSTASAKVLQVTIKNDAFARRKCAFCLA